MAERNRPADDPADERPDDEFVEETVADDQPVTRGGKGGTALAEAAPEAPRKKPRERIGLFGRIARFFREVVAELRKVIWPTRKELLTYTAVVVTFLAVITAIVVGLDYAFAKGVLWVFGS
jgi:preprotein translocase subunit SecE